MSVVVSWLGHSSFDVTFGSLVGCPGWGPTLTFVPAWFCFVPSLWISFLCGSIRYESVCTVTVPGDGRSRRRKH